MKEDELGQMIHDHIHIFLNQNSDWNAVNDWVNNLLNQSEIPNTEATAFTHACNAQIVYIIDKKELVINADDLFCKLFLEAFVWLNEISKSRITEIDLLVDKLFEVRVVKKISWFSRRDVL